MFCTQYQQKDWHQRLGSGVHAEAIMERIIHNTVELMARHGVRNSRDLVGPLHERGITLPESQTYRLIGQGLERISFRF